MQSPPDIARIERAIGFQRRYWRVERVAWIGLAGVILAALLGLFGAGGPLAGGTAEQAGVQVEWPRIARLGRVHTVLVTVPAAPGAEAALLRLDAAFTADWRLRDTTPPAAPMPSDDDSLVLRVVRDARGVARIALHADPRGRPGWRRLRLQAGGQRFDLPVFFWP